MFSKCRVFNFITVELWGQLLISDRTLCFPQSPESKNVIFEILFSIPVIHTTKLLVIHICSALVFSSPAFWNRVIPSEKRNKKY